jgi:hypothetical protein
MQSVEDRVAAGREALRRHAWHEAFEQLSAAKAARPLAGAGRAVRDGAHAHGAGRPLRATGDAETTLTPSAPRIVTLKGLSEARSRPTPRRFPIE